MIVTDHAVFLELQKSASTATRRLLTSVIGGEAVGKHNRLETFDGVGERTVIGTVRDPWSWYLSLWRYGCRGRGAVRSHLIERKSASLHALGQLRSPVSAVPVVERVGLLVRAAVTPTGEWSSLYDDPDDPARFHAWMDRLTTMPGAGRFGEGYTASLRAGVGFATHRFAALYAAHPAEFIEQLAAGRIDAAGDTVVDHMIDTRELGAGLLAALTDAGHVIDAEARDEILHRTARGAASTAARNYREVYSAELADRVASLDRALIDSFGFEY